MPLERGDFEPLIPHGGAMCLLDRVVRWDERHLLATTASHRAADNPLRRWARLCAVHALEYGAQAMAVHGALKARPERRRIAGGRLAACRDLRLHVPRLDDLAEPLTIRVTEQAAFSGDMRYRFRVDCDARPVAAGIAIIVAAMDGDAP